MAMVGAGAGSGSPLHAASLPDDRDDLGDRFDASDDGSDGSDVEAERDAADDILMLVRANTADRFLVRRTRALRPGSAVRSARSAAQVAAPVG